MNLAKFPRRRYTEGFTPIEALPRFSGVLGGPNIYIKRDDLLGLSAGGNKTRKLEFLVADALEQGKQPKTGTQEPGRHTVEAYGGPTNLTAMVKKNHDYRGEW